MNTSVLKSLTAAVGIAIFSNAPASTSEAPLFSLDVKSYASAMESITRIAEAMDKGSASSIDGSITALLGADLLEFIQPDKSWHFGLWMDYFGQPPLKAIYVPVTDFEGFRDALAEHALHEQNLTLVDQDGYAILIENESAPDVEIPPAAMEKITSYFANRSTNPAQAFSATVKISDSLRPMMLGGLEMGKGMMLGQMQASPDAPMDAELMKRIMDAYFQVFTIVVRDTDTLNIAFDIANGNLEQTLSLTPNPDTQLSRWLSQPAPALDTAIGSADWSADAAFVVSMGKLDAASRPFIENLMTALMPVYGLEVNDVGPWMQLIEQSLPGITAYSLDFADGMQLDSFYETTDGDARATYDRSVELSLALPTAPEAENSYYSKLEVNRDARTEGDHSVDQWIMELNFDHPTLQMPGQKDQMIALFGGEQIIYEATVIDDRIYFASQDRLQQAIERKNQRPEFQVPPAARMAGSMNMIAMLKASATADPDLQLNTAALDPEGTRAWMTAAANESLVVRLGLPLKMFKEMSKLSVMP